MDSKRKKECSKESYFKTDHLKADLRKRTIRGAGANIFSQILSLLVQLIGTMVLARLLTPADFGLVAMVTTFSLLVMNFGYNGFIEAIIQKEDIDHHVITSLFWLNAAISICLTLLFMCAAPFIAAFYDEPGVSNIVIWLSFSILLCGLSTIHTALLTRNMEFYATSGISLASKIISVIVPIVLAWMGWGLWSLVAGIISMQVATVAGVWIFCGWRPGQPTSPKGVAPIIKFALNTYGNFSLNYTSRNADNLLVGWYSGSQSLGFYKKAYDLFALPASLLTSQLTGVALAAMSRLSRNPGEYRRAYLDAVSKLAFIGMPLSAFFVLTGHDLVLLILGEQWQRSGEIFMYFGLGMGVMLIYATHGWIHLSLGRADRWFRWGIVELIVTVSLFIAATPLGPEWIAMAWTASFCLLIGPGLSYAGKPVNLTFFSILSVTWKYFASASIAGLLSWLVIPLIGIPVLKNAMLDRLVGVSINGIFCLLLYLILIVLFYGSAKPILQFIATLNDMIPVSVKRGPGR
jgi:polysaccharide transporter, PST family